MALEDSKTVDGALRQAVRPSGDDRTVRRTRAQLEVLAERMATLAVYPGELPRAEVIAILAESVSDLARALVQLSERVEGPSS